MDAARLACGITDKNQRACILAKVAQELADAGHSSQAASLAAEAEVEAEAITSTYRRADALTNIAQVLTAAGDPDHRGKQQTRKAARCDRIADGAHRGEH